VVQHRAGRPSAHGNLQERCGGGLSTSTDSPELMDENAHALIARPGQSKPFGLVTEPPVDLGDRDHPVVEPCNLL
jgi:hypothetical protein